MLLHDGSLVETLASIEIKIFGKGVGARVEKLETRKAMELVCILEGEVIDSLPSKFVKFRSFVGMPFEGFEKEISSLLKKLEARKERRVKVSGGKR